MRLIATGTQGQLDLAFAVGEEWRGGFIGNLTVTNAGAAPVVDWSVDLAHDFTIANMWGGRPNATAAGTRIDAALWQNRIAPGETVTVGFQASGTPAELVSLGDDVGDGGDPARPALTVAAPGDTAEGSPLAFRLGLDAPSDAPVSVAWSTAAGTATADIDFAPASGVATFAPGDTEVVLEVATVDDDAVEAPETLDVVLTAPVGATIADGQATGRILSDDVPTAIAADAEAREGDLAPGTASALGPLSTQGNAIVDAAGEPVVLAGVNWFGMETTRGAPDGLFTRNWRDMMDQMVEQGFNTIRLPFSNAALEPGSTPTDIDYAINPGLAGLSSLEVLDAIVAYAGEIGLRILLDNHRSTKGDGPEGNGLWYTAGYDEARWIDDWERLAERYGDDPAVIGADLRNEPHAASWGGGGPNDWAAAAERAGNAILDVDPDWLVVVEGVAAYQDDFYWWGGNLQGVADRPVVLDRPDQLVYSPHAYSADVFAQPWFSDPNYPANLPAIWDRNFGYIHQNGIAPLLVGEFGNRYADASNRQWLDSFVAYLGGDFDLDGTSDLAPDETGLSWAYWSWNPNSGDTGGLLADDWRTPVTAKLDALAPLLADATDFAALGDATVGEAPETTPLELALTLDQPAVAPASVAWRTVAGTAAPDADFVPASGRLDFRPGDTEARLTVTILGDDAVEGDETFAVVFSDPVGLALAADRATVTIRDDDGTGQPPSPPDDAPIEDEPAEDEPADQPDDQPDDDREGGAAGPVSVDIAVAAGPWWYQVDVALTNTGPTAARDWELALTAPLPEVAQIWNAVVAARDADGTRFATEQDWAATIDPGETVNFGFGGAPDGTALDAAALEASAAFDALFF